MTIATLTIHPLGNVERVGVKLDDRVQTWAFAVNGFDPLEVHFHEANGRQIAGLEVASELLNRDPCQLGVWVGFVVHAASVAQLPGRRTVPNAPAPHCFSTPTVGPPWGLCL